MLVLLTLIGLFSCQLPPTVSRNLANEIFGAQLEPAGWPSGRLGEDALRPFLGEGWRILGNETAELKTLGGDSHIHLNVSRPVPLRLVLEGRAESGEARTKVEVLVNGQVLKTVTLEEKARVDRLDVPAELLQEGANDFVLRCSRPCRWGTIEVAPRWLKSPRLKVEELLLSEQEIGLPNQACLHFPLELEGKNPELVVEALKSWVEPGVADFAAPVKLQVRVVSDSPVFDETWELPGDQPARLRLPNELKHVRLTLLALPEEEPEPGQNGLRIKAHVEFEAEPAIELADRENKPSPKPRRPSSQKRPNLIVYVIDTLRADHLSCYGYGRLTSPHLDALCRDGVRFRDVTAQSSWTKPSVATILTGLHPLQHGAQDFADKLPLEVTTLGERLADDYDVVAFVANGVASSYFQMTQGFKETLLMNQDSLAISEQHVLPWVRQLDPSQPFFAYIHTLDPHLPYQPPVQFDLWSEPKGGKVERNDLIDVYTGKTPELRQRALDLYDAEIRCADHALGELVAALKERNLYDDTLILVVSDHGEEFFEHGGYGHGHHLYQEVVSVPWVMKLPGQQDAGSVVPGSWQHLDIAPTVLANLGYAVPESMEGYAYRPGLGGPPEHREIYTHLLVGRDMEDSEMFNCPFTNHFRGVRAGSYSYLQSVKSGRAGIPSESLHNIEVDPAQQQELRNRQPVLATHLCRKLILGLRRFTSPPSEKAPRALVGRHLKALQYLD